MNLNQNLVIKEASFVLSVPDVRALPAPTFAELVMAGKSNVGKSSLINTIVGRQALARVSSTPGCTRGIPAKDPILILILNLIFVVIGYFIIGQWQKGIAGIVAALVIGIPTCGFGIGAVAIATAIDGFMQAQALQAGHPVAQWTFFKDHR